MLLVPTRTDPSLIPNAGMGLFAARDIPKGEIVWRFDPTVDRVMTEYEIQELPFKERQEVLFWGYLCKRSGLWIVCGDEGRRVNHSDTPNLSGGYTTRAPFGFSVANRLILAGEELTDNYFDYDVSAQKKLGR